MTQAPAVLLVHEDPDVLDWLTTLFEAAGYRVVIAATSFAARARLERTSIAVILVGWSVGGGAGEALARWAEGEGAELRQRIAALTDEPAEASAARAAGLPAYPTSAYQELLDFCERAAASAGGEGGAGFAAEPMSLARSPRLLLVEDDVHQVKFIRDILGEYGFDVSIAENAGEAIAALESRDLDVILCDWYMGGGGGEAVYDWMVERRPDLLDRCVFITGGSTRPIRERAPAATCFPKGQDSKILISALTRAARRAAGE